MEALILEIKTPGLHRYYALEGDSIRIGRALDNDIILSDPTVAPHHLCIDRDETGQLRLENLSAVNQLKINGVKQEKYSSRQLPVELELGRISARILPRDHVVENTRPLAKMDHQFAIMGQTFWAIFLPILCLLIGALQFYLDSYNALKWDALFGHLLRDIALGLTAFIVALSIIERLLVNRWEVKLVTIGVTLVYLLFQILSILVDESMYIFSSHWPLSIFGIGWYLFFIPGIISLYLIQVSHFKTSRSILLAILISSPFALPSILQVPTLKKIGDEFSPSPGYHKKLSALNWHLFETVSIDSFIQQAEFLKPGEFVD